MNLLKLNFAYASSLLCKPFVGEFVSIDFLPRVPLLELDHSNSFQFKISHVPMSYLLQTLKQIVQILNHGKSQP